MGNSPKPQDLEKCADLMYSDLEKMQGKEPLPGSIAIIKRIRLDYNFGFGLRESKKALEKMIDKYQDGLKDMGYDIIGPSCINPPNM